MNYLDLITAVLGLMYIFLEVRVSIWMWVVGFVMQMLGIVLYYQKGLYADCGMEFYYLAMTIYGFWAWTRVRPTPNPSCNGVEPDSSAQPTPLPDGRGSGVGLLPTRLYLPALLVLCLLWVLIWWLLVTFTNSTVPVADSFTTAMSIVGIWALARKYVEQWLLWIAVDAVSCYLYFLKEIPFKGSLYALYFIIAIVGFFRWRRQALGKLTVEN